MFIQIVLCYYKMLAKNSSICSTLQIDSYYFYDIYVSTMCIYCDYCVYHYKSTELVSLYTLDIGL